MLAVFEIIVRLAGALYILGGLVGLRQAQLDHVLDQALSGLTLKPVSKEDREERALLITISLTYGALGAAMAVLSSLAVPLLLLGALLIAISSVRFSSLTPRRYWPTALYAVIAGLTVWLLVEGRLLGWTEPLGFAAIGLTVLVLVAFLARHIFWKAGKVAPIVVEPDRPDPPIIPARRVRLEPTVGDWALIDIDRDQRISPFAHVGQDVGLWIELWEMVVGFDEDEMTMIARFEDPEAEARHRSEGARLVAELETHYGAGNVEGPVYPAIIKYGPWPTYAE
jgi:hypothetical protein